MPSDDSGAPRIPKDLKNVRELLCVKLENGKMPVKIGEICMSVKKYLENERLVNLLIFAFGVILVTIGILLEDLLKGQASTVLVSVGASIIASSIVAYITSIYILKRKKQKEVTELWGLKSITGSRAEMNIEIDKRIEKMSRSLDVVADGLKSFRESKSDLIKSKIARGVKVRILTVNPNAKILVYRDLAENRIEGSTANDIRNLVEWLEKIGADKPIEIRFCDFLPTELYFRVDDRIYVGPYEIGKESQRTITLEFAGDTKGFAYYANYFESLWQMAIK